VKEIKVKFKSILKTSVASAALLAVAAPVTSTSAVAEVKNGNDNALTISGHINRSMVLLDDGTFDEFNHVDGGTANSRMRFIATGSLTDTVSIGGTYEMNMANSNDIANADFSSATAGIDRSTSGGDSAFAVRQANIAFKHKAAGSLTIGQSTQANNNAGSAWGGNNFGTGGLNHMGDVEFRDNTAPMTNTSITAAAQFGMFDGGREDQVKYTLPGGLPFTGSVAYENGGVWMMGVNASADLAGMGVKMWGAYEAMSAVSATVDNQYHVGVAISHPSGLGLVARYGKEDSNATQAFDGEGRMVGVSYQTKAMSDLGSSHMRVTWGQNEDMSQIGDESSRMGFSFVQKLPAGTSVHIGYEEASYERTATTTYDDVSSFIAGAMITF
jgi:hypothetical protein